MITFYNPHHALHQGQFEMYRGALVPCHEVPARADHVLAELKLRELGEVLNPRPFGAEALQSIHAARYLGFLETAWEQWVALDPANADKDALPSVWPTRSFRTDMEPDNFAARMGLYSFDAGTPLTSGTWVAARAGAECALSAAQLVVEGGRSAFALSRPPGHHAGADFFGCYCFLNNAALAAQHLRNSGMERVAVLDVDYHHGNGTQAIFYDRPDVFFASLHGDPRTEYPFFLGYADEIGQGAGLGANLNLPMARGTDYAQWAAGFALQSEDYLRMGERIAKLGLPTALVFEGGYAVDAVGVNAVNVLQAFA